MEEEGLNSLGYVEDHKIPDKEFAPSHWATGAAGIAKGVSP